MGTSGGPSNSFRNFEVRLSVSQRAFGSREKKSYHAPQTPYQPVVACAEVTPKFKHHSAAILFVCSFGLTLYAQEPIGPRPKRARTPEDYQIGTLKEPAAKATSAESLANKEETIVADSDFSNTCESKIRCVDCSKSPKPKPNVSVNELDVTPGLLKHTRNTRWP
jgi:hypothetical protein